MTWHYDERCVGCGQRIKPGADWDWRHSINDTDAHDHGVDPGDYHETCCPVCNRTQEVAS